MDLLRAGLAPFVEREMQAPVKVGPGARTFAVEFGTKLGAIASKVLRDGLGWHRTACSYRPGDSRATTSPLIMRALPPLPGNRE